MDIAIAKPLTAAQIQARLGRHLTGLVVSPDADAWVNLPSRPRVAFWLHDDPPEFPAGFFTGFSVAVQPAEGVALQHWLIELSRLASMEFECQSFCDGSGFGDSDAPFWLVLWDIGVAYLADDSEASEADCDDHVPGPVKIIRPLGHLDIDVVRGGLDDAVHPDSVA